MYKLLLLLVLALSGCAEEPRLMIPYPTNVLEDAYTLDNVWILPNKNAKPKAPKDPRPFIAPLPYYCDPNVFPPNIVLTASACRIFLDQSIRQGYVIDR